MDTESKTCCCGARTGALVVGGLQVIGCSIFILFVSVRYSAIKANSLSSVYELDNFKYLSRNEQQLLLDANDSAITAAIVTLICVSAVQLALGMSLVVGVSKQCSKILKMWQRMELFLLVLGIAGTLSLLYKDEFLGVIPCTAFLMVQILSLYVVDVHHMDLADAQNFFRSHPV